MNRRNFLKMISVLIVGGVVALTKFLRVLTEEEIDDLFLPLITKNDRPSPSPTQEVEPSPTAASTPQDTPVPPPTGARVVHVSSAQATNWDQSNHRYWNYVNQDAINQMTDIGLMALTGATNIADAWQSLLPDYHPGQGIAIKVNFNNNFECMEDDANIDAIIQPVNSVVRGLKQIGVVENDIWVYDAVRRIPDRFVNQCEFSGVQFYDVKCRNKAVFGPPEASNIVRFDPPPGLPLPEPPLPIRITDLLIDATYLINMPIMKHHGCVGVTLAFKNHYGSISNCKYLHIYCDGFSYTPDWSPFVDVYLNPNIAGKTVLTIGDGLFGMWGNNINPPKPWNTFEGGFPNSLFFSTDPVAIDCVMTDFLHAEKTVPETTDDYLRFAHDSGLGVFERGDPWGSGYEVIDYIKIDVS